MISVHPLAGSGCPAGADHTKVLNELKGYAYMKGIAVPLESAPDAAKAIADLDKQSVYRDSRAEESSLLA